MNLINVLEHVKRKKVSAAVRRILTTVLNIFTLCKYSNTYPVLTSQAWLTEWAQKQTHWENRSLHNIPNRQNRDDCNNYYKNITCVGWMWWKHKFNKFVLINSWMTKEKKILKDKNKSSQDYDILVIQLTGNHHIYKLSKACKLSNFFTLQGIYSFQHKFIILQRVI